jgi:hypothetical protein
LLQEWKRREDNLYWVGMCAVVQRWKKNVDKHGEHVVKNNYACSGVIVKKCEIVTCQSCKKKKKKNGQYFLVASCI